MPQDNNNKESKPRVGLFVTCLVDLYRPNIGFAAIKLLEDAGCSVDVPVQQTCCGQPALNNGDTETTRDIARQVISAFEDYDYIVGASGSCMGTIKNHYPMLFKNDVEWLQRANNIADRSYELTGFLADVMQITEVDATYEGKATYHDSCSSLREMNVKQQPRKLLASVAGLDLTEMQDTDVCCGFGGTFCVKYPEISTRMVSDKASRVDETGADTLLAGDMGCLMNITGRLRRLDKPIRVYHVAEVLANMAELPGIGDSEDSE